MHWVVRAGLVLSVIAVESAAWGGTISGTVTSQRGDAVHEVVVFLKDVPGEVVVAEQPHVMDQKAKVFVPHVIPVVQGERVTFKNSDSLLHNVHAFYGRRTFFNVSIPEGGRDVTKQFDKLGDVPILCDVHPEMSAWVMVLENPYFALTDEAGTYELSDVPEGTYTLSTWHEKLKAQEQDVTVPASGTVTVDLTLSR